MKWNPFSNGDSCGGHHFENYEPMDIHAIMGTSRVEAESVLNQEFETGMSVGTEMVPRGNRATHVVNGLKIVVRRRVIAVCEHEGCHVTDEKFIEATTISLDTEDLGVSP